MNNIHHKLELICVSGIDAFDFLQAQLTQDLNLLEKQEQGIWSAYCSPKGKVLATFYIFKHHECFYLVVDSGLCPIMMKRLSVFVMRRKVVLQSLALSDAAFLESFLQAYHQTKTKNIAWITEKTSDLFTPHMLELDKIAVSFTKGCYPGQEVVARSQYLGSVKRGLHTVLKASLAAEVLDEQTLLYQQGIALGDYVIISETDNDYVLCGAKISS